MYLLQSYLKDVFITELYEGCIYCSYLKDVFIAVIWRMYLLQSYLMVKKDIEIQPRFEPGSSECWSDALTNWATGTVDTQFTGFSNSVPCWVASALTMQSKAYTKRSNLRIELCLWIYTVYPLLQCQSSSGSDGKSLWPAFGRPRFKSWLDLNVFFSPWNNSAINTSFIFQP